MEEKSRIALENLSRSCSSRQLPSDQTMAKTKTDSRPLASMTDKFSGSI